MLLLVYMPSYKSVFTYILAFEFVANEFNIRTYEFVAYEFNITMHFFLSSYL
jgi:hypothetical protein